MSSAASKRRKVGGADTTPSTRSSARGIANFARTTKATALAKSVSDSKLNASPTATAEVGGKRKLETVVDVEEIHVDVEETIAEATTILNATSTPSTRPAPITRATSERAIRPLPQRRATSQVSFTHPPKTPARQVAAASTPVHTPGSVQTPTNGLRGLLDNFFLPSSPKATDACDVDDDVFSSSAVLESSQTTVESSPELPEELHDMINMHSSFLTSLTLHYAHNGTHTPCDIKQLCPNVARCWGKRAVNLTDIKRLLGILNHAPPSSSQSMSGEKALAMLSISDYGNSKLCIEIRTFSRLGRMAKPLDENTLNTLFYTNLEALWADADTVNIGEFTKSLPVEEVRMCASVSKMSPLLAKGQRRLEDLRHGIIIKKKEEEDAAAAKAAQAQESSSPGTPTRKPTLLERLRMKAEEKKNAPPPLSKEELARIAALGRLEEVVAVLTQLSTAHAKGQARVSFTLPTVIGKMKDSFKTPIAKSEAECCIRLLCNDVAPEWCQMVKMGRGAAMIVLREQRPSDEILVERLKEALEMKCDTLVSTTPMSSPVKMQTSP